MARVQRMPPSQPAVGEGRRQHDNIIKELCSARGRTSRRAKHKSVGPRSPSKRFNQLAAAAAAEWFAKHYARRPTDAARPTEFSYSLDLSGTVRPYYYARRAHAPHAGRATRTLTRRRLKTVLL